MLLRRFALIIACVGLLVCATIIFTQQPGLDEGIFDQSRVDARAADNGQDGIESQARGPVHEAFANPSSSTVPHPQPVAPNAPPALVEELPPDEKPTGDNVHWLSGYWHYDQDLKDYLWVSGLWRQIPPGLDWVPGTWNSVPGGYQWSSGFWKHTEQVSLAVVPTPPQPLNTADTPAPNADSTYVPGSWVYRESRYVWRPSYWLPCRPGWVWVPARYVWSPCGYYYVDGYWDYALRDRGLLFCPVVIRRDFLRPGFLFRPRFVVHDVCLLSCLFVHGGYGSYYFGDYYDDIYARRGYIAWSNYRINRLYHDSLFSYYRFEHRGNPAWERDLLALTALRFRNEAPRPPVSLILQNKLILNHAFNINQTRNMVLLAPLARVNPRVVPLVKLDAIKLQEQRNFAKSLHEASVKRSAFETHIVTTKTIPRLGEPVRTVALTVPQAHSLPSVERLRTLPPAPAGHNAQVDAKVINNLANTELKYKGIRKDKK